MKNPTTRIHHWIAICFFALIATATHAQSNKPVQLTPGCGTRLYLQDRYQFKYDLFEYTLLHKQQQRFSSKLTDTKAIYTIPVVFHVVHQNGAENISETDIRQTLNQLNDAYANRNAFQRADGVDIGIRFCLSQKGPDGNNRVGITRHVSPYTNVLQERDDNALKAIEQWDPLTYINIWIVRDINTISAGPGVAAYATMPNTHGALFDGIVVEAGFMDGAADNAKVLIHEIGHYLGLYHTFEGGCKNDNCLVDGDKVYDTPPDASVAPVACGITVNTCTTDANDLSTNNPFRPVANGGLGDQPDMTRNYMDYGFLECQDKFTEGQRLRMRDALETALGSLLLNTTICAECNSPIIATINVANTISAGVPITFSLTLNNPSVTVNWNIDGQLFNNQSTVTLNFPQQKDIVVIATITNSDPGCITVVSKDISVTCGANPVFTASPDGLVSPGEIIHFATAATGTLTWKLDGAVVATGASFDYTVPDEKSRLLTLTVDNGTCKAESAPYYIQPGNCSDSKENNTWYFGNGGGIDFNQKPAKAIIGKLGTEEGCAVLCDENGQADFHSTGSYVANSKLNSILLNGSGLTGHTSTTQAALFVPMPGSDRYIYLFTLVAEVGYFNSSSIGKGLSYSLIDRQGDGGKGAVTQKNVEILAEAPEQLTSVKNNTGTGVWVIAHGWNTNAFYAWLVSDTGISSTPVISHVGTVHNSPAEYAAEYAIGHLVPSPSGKRLAIANQGGHSYELFDFDNATGIISNAIKLENEYTTDGLYGPYGVAFSPDEHYLYGSNHVPLRLLRFDITGAPTAINNSVQLIYESSLQETGGSLQLAPDGRIYLARYDQHYLGVIGNPNARQLADCQYTHNGLMLYSNSKSTFGLPNPVQSIYLSVKPIIYGPAKICRAGSTDSLVKYSFTRKGRATYSFIHTGINTVDAVTDSTITLRISNNGRDTLVLKRSAPCMDLYDTLYISSGVITPVSIGNDITICKGIPANFTATPGFAEYIWSNDQFTPSATFNAEGPVWVDAINQSGCVYRDSALITYYKLPELSLGKDTSLCNSATMMLTAPPGMDSYSWNTGDATQSIAITDSGTYRVTVGKFGCLFRDTIYIGKNVPDSLFAKDTIYGCSGTSLTVPHGYTSYQWTLPDGTVSTEEKLSDLEGGMYHLTWTNNCGTRSDSIFVKGLSFVDGDTLQTCNDTLFVKAAFRVTSIFNLGVGYSAFANIAANNLDISITRTGDYGLSGNFPVPGGPSCLVTQIVHVIVDSSLTRPPLVLNIGNDTTVCESAVVNLAASPVFNSYWWNNGSRESFTTVFGPGLYYVDAKYCGYIYTDSIRIIKSNALHFNLGNDTALCSNASLVLHAGASFDWYRWSSGQTTSSINVQAPGTYIAFAGKDNCVSSDTIVVTTASVTTCNPPPAIGCKISFRVRPNPGNNYVNLFSGCPLAANMQFNMRVISIDRKELMVMQGNIDGCNAALNQLMPLLASSVYIIDLQSPTNETIKQRIKWVIAR